MRILFTSGVGILPEQRIKRWQMVTRLYGDLGRAFSAMGHQVFYAIHPDALTDDIPSASVWLMEDHKMLKSLVERFEPDYCFCWNGSSPADVVTASIVEGLGAKMVFSEQGWFPQKDSLYFDFNGCNGKCSTIAKTFPELSARQHEQLDSARASYIKSYVKLDHWCVEKYAQIPVDLAKPIFVPLQDERDLNIVQDSPFKTMFEFVTHLSKRYPKQRFIVRPHPKYPSPKLPIADNVIIDDPKRPMFDTLNECGLVIGINSTTLLESALLGYQVVSFGRSLATRTGLFVDVNSPDDKLELSSIVQNDVVAPAVLYHLLCVKQFLRDDLDKPGKIMRSNIFKEMLKQQNWNALNS
jgi:hypothetical protein